MINAPFTAPFRISGVINFVFCFLLMVQKPSLSPQSQMLCNGAQRQRREEGQRSEDVNNAHQADGEGGAVGPMESLTNCLRIREPAMASWITMDR